MKAEERSTQLFPSRCMACHSLSYITCIPPCHSHPLYKVYILCKSSPIRLKEGATEYHQSATPIAPATEIHPETDFPYLPRLSPAPRISFCIFTPDISSTRCPTYPPWPFHYAQRLLLRFASEQRAFQAMLLPLRLLLLRHGSDWILPVHPLRNSAPVRALPLPPILFRPRLSNLSHLPRLARHPAPHPTLPKHQITASNPLHRHLLPHSPISLPPAPPLPPPPRPRPNCLLANLPSCVKRPTADADSTSPSTLRLKTPHPTRAPSPIFSKFNPRETMSILIFAMDTGTFSAV